MKLWLNDDEWDDFTEPLKDEGYAAFLLTILLLLTLVILYFAGPR